MGEQELIKLSKKLFKETTDEEFFKFFAIMQHLRNSENINLEEINLEEFDINDYTQFLKDTLIDIKENMEVEKYVI